jgi:hypothetical protein
MHASPKQLRCIALRLRRAPHVAMASGKSVRSASPGLCGTACRRLRTSKRSKARCKEHARAFRARTRDKVHCYNFNEGGIMSPVRLDWKAHQFSREIDGPPTGRSHCRLTTQDALQDARRFAIILRASLLIRLSWQLPPFLRSARRARDTRLDHRHQRPL